MALRTEDHVERLHEEGWTIVEQAVEPALIDELDEALQTAQGHTTAKVHAFMRAHCYEAWCVVNEKLVRHQNGRDGACAIGAHRKDDVLFRYNAACASKGKRRGVGLLSLGG